MYDRVQKIIKRTSVLIACVGAMSTELQEVKAHEKRELKKR